VHSDFFDIRLINKWSHNHKIFYHLSDLWIFTGHCGVPIDCERYKLGCGECPDLDIPPSIKQDKTRDNYKFKNKILIKNPLHFISPSNWVYNQVKDIKIHPNSTHTLITNSIDTALFAPGNRSKLRKKMNFSSNDIVIATSAVGFKDNPYKDINTLIEAFNKIKSYSFSVYLLMLGDKSEKFSGINNKNIFFINRLYNPADIIDFYRSANIFVHSSHIETWGYTVSEALSVGIPLIASDVGGIKDQIKGYNYNQNKLLKSKLNKYNLKKSNGILFKRSEVNDLVNALEYLIENRKERIELGKNARNFALKNLDVKFQLEKFLNLCTRIKF
jgi:glycosyltransferase involved in cell wall biosynthesis